MGYMRHHAIIVTGFDKAVVEAAQAKAQSLDMNPSELLKSHVNGYLSFLIPPDGSKEGWNNSDVGDTARREFLEWIYEVDAARGYQMLNWVEVQYGDDEGNTLIVRHSDDDLAFKEAEE